MIRGGLHARGEKKWGRAGAPPSTSASHRRRPERSDLRSSLSSRPCLPEHPLISLRATENCRAKYAEPATASALWRSRTLPVPVFSLPSARRLLRQFRGAAAALIQDHPCPLPRGTPVPKSPARSSASLPRRVRRFPSGSLHRVRWSLFLLASFPIPVAYTSVVPQIVGL